MIKNGMVERWLTEIESAVCELWCHQKSELVDLCESGAKEHVLFLLQSFRSSSSVFGEAVIFLDLDAEDIAELHLRLYRVMKKIRKFPRLFLHYCESPIRLAAESFYAWFRNTMSLKKIPESERESEAEELAIGAFSIWARINAQKIRAGEDVWPDE